MDGDLRKRVKERLEGIRKEFETEVAKENEGFRLDYEMLPPSVEPFVPYGTMFKMTHEDSDVVECVNCGALFSARDLLDGELEEDECPACHTWAAQYWQAFPHRKVPANL